ncbi:hypothetical protein B0H13DRAFT_2323074 [Mycena leptocephala]|nr:hypothetical protein B0H13DRAFT_2323074 [Mycena leptocephala]
MALLVSAPIDTHVTEIFAQDSPAPAPLAVLIQDTDIPFPQLMPLLAHTTSWALSHTRRSTGYSAAARHSRTRAGRVSTPYPSTGGGSSIVTRSSTRSTISALTELGSDDANSHRYPPAPSTAIRFVRIPRPPGVQLQYQSQLETLLGENYRTIYDAVQKAAAERLDVLKAYSDQDPRVMQKLKAIIYKQHGKLAQFDGDWALQGFLTLSLKNLKAKKDGVEAEEAPNPGPLHELADLGASIASADGERSNKLEWLANFVTGMTTADDGPNPAHAPSRPRQESQETRASATVADATSSIAAVLPASPPADHSVRWSELSRLPHWNPSQMLVVDPMHFFLEV